MQTKISFYSFVTGSVLSDQSYRNLCNSFTVTYEKMSGIILPLVGQQD